MAYFAGTATGSSGHAAAIFSRAQLPERGAYPGAHHRHRRRGGCDPGSGRRGSRVAPSPQSGRIVDELRSQIALFDERIQELVAEHPEQRLFASFPSAGPVLVPRLIVAFGTQRDRYGTANDLQSLSGIAPVTERSGKQEWVHFRWACSHFLRQTFHEYAAHSI